MMIGVCQFVLVIYMIGLPKEILLVQFLNHKHQDYAPELHGATLIVLKPWFQYSLVD